MEWKQSKKIKDSNSLWDDRFYLGKLHDYSSTSLIQHQKLIPIHSFNNLKRIKLNKLPHIKPQSFYLPSHTKKPSPKPTILAPLPILPKVSYKIQKNANISAFPIDSSSSDSEQHENYDFESEKISFDIVEAYVSANCNKIAIKCIKDIISASLGC